MASVPRAAHRLDAGAKPCPHGRKARRRGQSPRDAPPCRKSNHITARKQGKAKRARQLSPPPAVGGERNRTAQPCGEFFVPVRGFLLYFSLNCCRVSLVSARRTGIHAGALPTLAQQRELCAGDGEGARLLALLVTSRAAHRHDAGALPYSARKKSPSARAVAARCTALQKEQLHHRAEARQSQASAAIKPSSCRRRRAEPHGAAVRGVFPHTVLVENFCMLCVVWLLYPVRRTGLTREHCPTPHGR